MLYDPAPDGELTAFPDDFWTEDAVTPTGKRIALRVEDTPMLQGFPENFVGIFDDLSTLDGWGLTAGMFLRANDVLPELRSDQLRLYAAGRDWPLEIRTTDGGQTLLVRPYFPLPEATTAALVYLTDPASESCVAPSAYTRRLLDPAAAEPAPAAARYQAVLAEMGVAPENVAGMTVFTTQSATHVGRAVAADVAARDYSLTAPMTCAVGERLRTCDGFLTVQDYRADDHIVPMDSTGTPLGSYDLPVRVWLPEVGSAPFPTLLCGHGLGGGRGQCEVLAEQVWDKGIAVVAVDAVEHGDHPGRTVPDISLIEDFMIFAITMDPPGLNALRLRDNFRQSAWDKLQVIRAIEGGMDVEGDGTVDLDASHLGYVGVSLGAIMGPEPMALSPRLNGAALVVGGGRISSIIQESASFGVLVDLMRPPGLGDGEVDRFFPVLQTVIDAADPMIWGHYVLEERFDERQPPSTLVMLAYDDQIVPNSSNDALVRGLGLSGVGTQVWETAEIPFVDAPLSGNLVGGGTAGLLQMGTVQMEPGGPWEPADHSSLHESVQGKTAIHDFLQAVLRDEVPVITDPDREP
jgi:hypothetical protein